jgi:hypothetical protein
MIDGTMFMSRLDTAWPCVLAATLLLGCSQKAPEGGKAAQTNGATTTATGDTTDPLAALDARLFAHARVQTYGLTDKHVREYVPAPDVGTGEVPQFGRVLSTLAGDLPASALRDTGNVELLFFAPGDGDVDWAAVVPVTSTEDFIKAMGAQEDRTEVGLLNARRGGQTLHLNTKQVVYASRATTDAGAHVTLASSRDVALYAPALVARHATEQIAQISARLWPRRAGLAPRYAVMADELRALLSVNGHALPPARAGVVNLQSLLYSELGAPSSWPESMTLTAVFKIRNKPDGTPYPKDFQTQIDIPADGSARLLKLWSSIETKPKSTPPALPVGQGRALLILGRSDIEQAIEALLPERQRMLLAASGEDDMKVLQGSLLDLFEHNRGGTSIATFPQTYPLSGELIFAFDVMDAEKLPDAANQAQEVLVERLLKPLHLGALTDVDTSPFTDTKAGLRGASATFVVPGPEGKDVTLGSCWALGGPSFYAYVGVDPCTKLRARVTQGGDGENAPVAFEVPVSNLMNTLYVGPNQRVDALADAQELVPIDVYPRVDKDNHFFHVDLSIAPRTLSQLAGVVPDLAASWSYASSYDVSAMASRAAIEQAIYQEPGIMVLGPPGLLGALPPTYYFGLPFSVPPAPPSQLREAILGDGGPDGKTP